MKKRLFGIRGAVCAENTVAGIRTAVGHLAATLFAENPIAPEDIVSIQFTVTDDLTALNPATALRSAIPVDPRCALFCSQEPKYDGSLPRTIRILVTAYMNAAETPKAIFTLGAEKLRPDLAERRE